MASNNQSQIQSVLEGLTSVNATAQNNQPANPNNGNPNTINNVNPNVAVIPPQADANGNWWTPPVNSGIDLQGLIGQLPQVTNPNINNIIDNLTRPPAPAPAPPGGNPPPGPGPTPTPPARPPGWRPPGSGPRPVGPISGPVDEWLRSPRPGSPPDTTAPTNLFDNEQGREYAMDWLRMNQGSFDQTNGALNVDSDLGQNLQNIIGSTTGRVREYFSNLFNTLRGEGGWRAALAAGARIAGAATGNPLISLLGSVFGRMSGGEGEDEMVDFELNEETLARLNQLNDDQMAEATALIQQVVDDIEIAPNNQSNMEEFFNSRSEYSDSEWREVLESMAWNNMWNGTNTFMGSNGGTRQNTLGLPAMDMVDQMINGINENALNWTEFFQNMAGNRER